MGCGDRRFVPGAEKLGLALGGGFNLARRSNEDAAKTVLVPLLNAWMRDAVRLTLVAPQPIALLSGQPIEHMM